MTSDREQNIVDPELARTIAHLLRAGNPATAPISPESAARYGIIQLTDARTADTTNVVVEDILD